jgi:hypothetical protein
LLGQLWDGNSTESVRATAGERSEADHEEMETREWHHVNSQLAEIRVKLTRETETSGDARHDGRDQVVKISVGWSSKLKSSDADIVESLVIDTEGLIRVLNKLVDGEGGIVWLNDGIGDLGGWNDGESSHHTVWELLANLGDQKRTHTGTSSTTKRVGDLETLKTVAALGLTTNNIKDLVDKLGTLSIMALGPVVSCTRLSENEVIGTEELTEWTGTNGVHGTRLQVDKNGTRNILVSRSLRALVDFMARPLCQ